MLLVLPEFDLLATDTVEETCALLGRHDGDARVLAGGTDLLVKMKHRRLLARHLINIKRIPGLDQIRYDDQDGLRIGALVNAQAIKESSVIANRIPLLSQAAGRLGTLQIRHIATLGGNLANASPSAEFAPALLTLAAVVKCAGSAGERLIPIDEFFAGPGKSALRPDEVITEIHVPSPPANAAGIYLKHALRRMDVAIAAVAAVVHLDRDVCTEARIALGAVGPTPFRARKAEAALTGQKLGRDAHARALIREAAYAASNEARPIDDFRDLAAHRSELVGQLVTQALEQLASRAQA